MIVPKKLLYRYIFLQIAIYEMFCNFRLNVLYENIIPSYKNIVTYYPNRCLASAERRNACPT